MKTGPFTPYEDAEIIRLRALGLEYGEIGEALGRTWGAICSRITVIGADTAERESAMRAADARFVAVLAAAFKRGEFPGAMARA